MSESEIQQKIQIEAAKFGCILMRNNSGAFRDPSGRVIFYGLGNISKKHNEHTKSSDLIGITTLVVTPEMVGKTIGVFTAFEVKDENWQMRPSDRRAQAQQNFIDWVVSKGGIGKIVKSVAEAISMLKA